MDHTLEFSTLVDRWRYERKFVIPSLSKQEVESIIKFHPAMFHEIFCERTVNNIYFDTANYQNYFDNETGYSQRQKIRIRWYGDISHVVIKPILEIKIKNSNLGGKIQHPLPEMPIHDSIDEAAVKNLIKISDVPKQIKIALSSYEVKIINRYRRKYFQAKEKDFRITLDSNLEYYKSFKRQNYLQEKIVDRGNIILELKYGSDSAQWASEIASQLPFRMTKNSKYIRAVEYHLY